MDEKGQQRIRKIIADVLGLDEAKITPNFSYNDTDRWDSLKHMQIITALEQNFSVTLTADEIISMVSVDEIERILGQKKG